MESPFHDIDDIFYSGVERHREQPANSVWNSIEADLDKGAAQTYKARYYKLIRNSIVVVLLLSGAVFYQGLTIANKKTANSEDKAVATAPLETVVVDKETIHVPELPATSIPPANSETKLATVPAAEVKETNVATTSPAITSSASTNLPARKRELAQLPSSNDVVIGIPTEANINTSITLDAIAAANVAAITKNTTKTTKTYKSNISAHSKKIASSFVMAQVEAAKKDLATGLRPDLLIPAIPLSAHPQYVKKPEVNDSRFSLAAFFAPSLTWTTVKENTDQRIGGGTSGGGNGNANGGNPGGGTGGNVGVNTPGTRGNSRDEIVNSESNRVGYSTGIEVGYQLTDKLTVKSGANYRSASTGIDSKWIYADKDLDGTVAYRLYSSNGFTYLAGQNAPRVGDSIVVSNAKNSVSYLGIPLTLQYSIVSSGRFSLAASAGAQYNMLLNGTTRGILAEGSANAMSVSNNIQGLRKSYISGLAGLNAEFQVKDNLYLTLNPSAQFGLSFMTKGTHVMTRPNYFGFAAGVKLKL